MSKDKVFSQYEIPELEPKQGLEAGGIVGGDGVQSANYVPGQTGYSLNPDGSAEFTDVTILGGLEANEIHVPDQDTTANSAHIQNDGDTWWGCTETNFNSNNDNATAYVLKTGVAKFQNVAITGASSTIGGKPISTYSLLDDGATPANPSGLTATAGYVSVFLKWTANTETDINHYEIWRHTADVRASATKIAETKANIASDQGVSAGTAYYYWIKAVDNAGNTSGFNATAGTTATPVDVGTPTVNISDQGWTQTCVFSSTDADTVSWTSGTFTTSHGTTYNIDAGNTGNMSARTYIYLDIAVSTTAFQTTTTASLAVGTDKVMVGAAINESTGAKYIVYGGNGQVFVSGTDIATGSITSGNIAANTITAADIAAGTITSNEIAANTITAVNIAAGTITTTQIAANTIVAGNIAAGTITSNKMNVTDLSAISANMGSITSGTITLNTTGNIRSGQTDFNTGDGWWLGISSGTAKFSIGKGGQSSNNLYFDGSDLYVNGSKQGQMVKTFTAYEAITAGQPVYYMATSHAWDNGTKLSIADGSQTGLDLSGDFTIEAWCYFDVLPSVAGTEYAIVDKESAGQESYYMFVATDNRLYWGFLDSSGRETAFNTSAAVISATGTWVHLAVACQLPGSGASGWAYVNGSSVGANRSDNSASTIRNGTADFVIGNRQANNRTFNGRLEEVRVWSDVRTAQEISDNYTQEISASSGNLAGYWRFNGSLLDETSNNNDLTATGGSFASGKFDINKVRPTSATNSLMCNSFLGFAQSTVAADASVAVAISGIDDHQSGLTPGTQYYISDTSGTLSSSAGTVTRKAAVALSSTEVMVTNIW